MGHTRTASRSDTPECFERTTDSLRTNFGESTKDSQDESMELEIRKVCLYPPRYLTQGSQQERSIYSRGIQGERTQQDTVFCFQGSKSTRLTERIGRVESSWSSH